MYIIFALFFDAISIITMLYIIVTFVKIENEPTTAKLLYFLLILCLAVISAITFLAAIYFWSESFNYLRIC